MPETDVAAAREPSDEEVVDAAADLMPGVLCIQLLEDLDEAIRAAREAPMEGAADKAQHAAMLSSLAQAADAVDRIRARADAELAAGVAPDLAARAGMLLARIAIMLQASKEVRGRFAPADAPEPELQLGEFAAVRVIPDGFEDLDPKELVRVGGLLETAAGGAGA